MAFSKVKVGGLADDSVTAANIDDDGTGYTVGNLTNSGTLQQTGQATFGSGGTNWTLPTSRGTDKYVLQIQGGTADWAESLTAPELSGHNFDVSGTTDDGGINAYEAPYAYTGTTNETTTISSLSSTTGLLVGQYISGPGIPADTTISSVNSGASSIVISNAATATASGVALKIQKTPGEKNGGKVTLTGTNFGATIGELSVAITTSSGSVIANASYLSGLSGGNTITAEWIGTEGSYSTDLTSSYTGKIYFKVTKSGLASNILDTNTTLTTDGSFTTLSTSSQTGGDRSVAPSATSLGTYGNERIAGGGQDSNTKALLNFDRFGGTDFEDSSNIGGDGHKITATNAVIKASPFGDGRSAIYINGSTHKLQIPNSTDFNLGTSACVEFWVYQESSTSPHNIINHGGVGTSDYDGWTIAFQKVSGQDDGISFYRRASGTNHTLSSGGGYIKTNHWHHVAYTRDGTTARIFIDGKLANSGSDVTTTAVGGSNNDLKIGIEQAEGGGRFAGYIDEIRIVNGSPVYTSDFTVPTSRLTAITNTKLLIHSNQTGDSSDDNRTLTYGGVTFKSDQSQFGGGSIYWDGSNDYIHAPVGTAIGTGVFTFDFWIYPESQSSSNAQQNVLDIRSHDGSSFGTDGFVMQWNKADNKLKIYDAVAGSYIGTPSTAISLTAWTHIAFERYDDSGTKKLKLYINGVQDTGFSSGAGVANSSNYSATSFTIGNGSDGGSTNVIKGYIDEFRFSSVARYNGTAFNSSLPSSPYSSDANTKLLIHGDFAKFTDSATSGTTHTITATGAFHADSSFHKGIAPPMTWPASGKANGTSGAYFDGTTDVLNLNLTNDNDYDTVFTTGVWSLDTWCYMITHPENSMGRCILAGTDNSAHGYNIGYYNATKGNAGYWGFIGPGTSFTPSTNTTDTAPLLTWFHILMVCNWSGDNMTLKVYRDGKYLGQQTSSGLHQALSNYTDHDRVCIGGDAYTNIGGGTATADKHNWYGYLFNWRYSGNDVTADSSDPLFTNSQTSTSSNNFVQGLPTRAYGAFGEDTPDVGTITLTATGTEGEGDYTWSEVAGGTALPGSLAVGSTTHSGSGDSRTHTATVTGSFTALTTSFANGIRSDQTTNNILLKAQNDTDATKAITLGSSGGYDGIGITQKSSGNPILFNARRYMGNGTTRDINGLGFQPDLVWVKNRDATHSHALFDSVRGVTNRLYPDANSAQDSSTITMQSFNSDGFSIGTHTHLNTADNAYIAWAWKAGGPIGSGSAPSDEGKFKLNGESTERIANDYPVTGSGYAHGKSEGVAGTTYEASYNVDSGFAIIKTTSAGDGTTGNTFPTFIGTPDVIFAKQLDSANHWFVYHSSAGITSNHRNPLYLNLNERDDTSTTNAWGVESTIGANSGRTWDLGSNNATNNNGTNHRYVYYLWKAVTGVSAFGTYEGDGGSNRTITTGFKPRYVMVKNIDVNGRYWAIQDAFRTSGDTSTTHLYADLTNADDIATSKTMTFIDTGFSFTTNSTYHSINEDGQTFIYMAYA